MQDAVARKRGVASFLLRELELHVEPQDNKRLALQKAINSHEQAAAALLDLMTDPAEARYAAMLARIQQNVTELQAEAATTDPSEHV